MTEQEILLTSILNCPRSSLYSQNLRLNNSQKERLSDLLQKRTQGLPLQYLTADTEFFGLNFKVDKRVLIPRPETEILVEQALKYIRKLELDSIDILDIGTGSGCIGISLAKFIKEARVVSIDISEEALIAASENAGANGVEGRIKFLKADLMPEEKMKFDVIISNPPYIPTNELQALPLEVKFEPRIALDGGKDGLSFYRRIIRSAKQFLKPSGLVIFEMGFGQWPGIKNIFDKAGGFCIIDAAKDYNGIERVITAKWTNSL